MTRGVCDDAHGAVVKAQVRTQNVRHGHRFTIVEGGLRLVEGYPVLRHAVIVDNRPCIEQLLVEEVIFGRIREIRFVVAPLSLVGEVVFAAIRLGERIKIYTVFELEVVDDLVVRVVVAIIITINGHAVGREGYATIRIGVGDAVPSIALTPLASTPDPHVVPLSCLAGVHLEKARVELIVHDYGRACHTLDEQGVLQAYDLAVGVRLGLACLLDAQLVVGDGRRVLDAIDIDSVRVLLEVQLSGIGHPIAILQPVLVYCRSQLDRDGVAFLRALEARDSLVLILEEGDDDFAVVFRSIGETSRLGSVALPFKKARYLERTVFEQIVIPLRLRVD